MYLIENGSGSEFDGGWHEVNNLRGNVKVYYTEGGGLGDGRIEFFLKGTKSDTEVEVIDSDNNIISISRKGAVSAQVLVNSEMIKAKLVGATNASNVYVELS